MLAGVSKLALVGKIAVPLLNVAVPELPAEGGASTAPAAALCVGLLSATLNVPAARAVGLMRNLSPDAGVPDNTMFNPSAVTVLPLTLKGTELPSVALVKE